MKDFNMEIFFDGEQYLYYGFVENGKNVDIYLSVKMEKSLFKPLKNNYYISLNKGELIKSFKRVAHYYFLNILKFDDDDNIAFQFHKEKNSFLFRLFLYEFYLDDDQVESLLQEVSKRLCMD